MSREISKSVSFSKNKYQIENEHRKDELLNAILENNMLLIMLNININIREHKCTHKHKYT